MIKTKQELLNHFSDINAMYNNPFMYQTLSNMIDELLEQEPCEDCVSRKAVNMLSIDLVYVTGDKADFLCKFWTGLDALPPVTPKAKTGHWIMKHRSYSEMKYLTGTDEMGIEHTVKKYESYEIDEPYCSECGKLAGDTSQNYCCACGVKMESEE